MSIGSASQPVLPAAAPVLPAGSRALPAGLTASSWSPAALARLRAVRHGLVAAGLLFAGYLFLVGAPLATTFGYDAWAYWSLDPTDPYRRALEAGLGSLGAYLYSPAFAQLLAPVQLLPWWVFLWLWSALLLGTVLWLGGRSALPLLAFPPVALELYHGNVHLLLAAAGVLGLRYPAAWALVLLTKVTPGVGVLWFASRGEWRRLAVAATATAVVAGASIVIDPTAWAAWIATLAASSGVSTTVSLPLPLGVRLPLAALLVCWGGRTDRAWTVPVAMTLALPVVWLAGLSMLVAVVPLRRSASRATLVPASS